MKVYVFARDLFRRDRDNRSPSHQQLSKRHPDYHIIIRVLAPLGIEPGVIYIARRTKIFIE